MDLVAAYRAFLHVSERGSFTLGAAAAQIPQPVASRRVAALEKHLGEQLLDRSGYRVTLTSFGRGMLPSAKQLVHLVDAMEYEAQVARLGPVRVAVPDVCRTRDLAALVAAAGSVGVNLELRPAPPRERAELARLSRVDVAVTAAPEGLSRWTRVLGLAGGRTADRRALHLETLRATRAGHAGPRQRVWVQPEDDVPHVVDPLRRLADATGLAPSQVAIASTLVSAAGAVLGSSDLLLCSPDQAEDLGLRWRPLGGATLVRGYDLAGANASMRKLLLDGVQAALECCLGDVTAPGEGR